MSSLSNKLARRNELLGARAAEPKAETRSFVEHEGERLHDFEPTPKGEGMLHARRSKEPVHRRYGAVELGHALSADARLLARLGLLAELEGLPLERALFLDTETSGLGGGTGNRAFLVGMAWFDPTEDVFVLEQLFLRDLDDEAALLERVRERVEESAFIVSYNGKSFDVPLLRSRMMLARVGAFPERPHLDLLHLARRVHDRRGWRMSLGTVERRVLGFERGPDVGGEEVAMRYAHFLWSGDEGCLREVVDHNRHDVWSLVALLGHYGQPPREEDEGGLRLEAPELSAMARVMGRAGDLAWASRVADHAVRRSASEDAEDALWTRARIAKSRGDKAAAVADFEALLASRDDPDARLELAKLYEHFVKDPARALALVESGTAEPESDRGRRRERLLRKMGRNGP